MAITMFDSVPFIFPRGGLQYSAPTNEKKLNASGLGVATRFVVPATGDLEAYAFAYGSVSSFTMDFGLETNSSGKPSGSAYASFTPETSSTISSNGVAEQSLSSPPAVTKGDVVWATIIRAGGSSTIGGTGSPGGDGATWETSDSGSTWATAGSETVAFFVKIDGTWYCSHKSGIGRVRNTSTITQSPEQKGLGVTFPFTCEIVGVYSDAMDIDSTTELVAYLYDDNDVEQWTRTYHFNNWPAANLSSTHFLFGEEFTVNSGEEWKFVFESTTGAGGRTYGVIEYDIDAIKNAVCSFARDVTRADKTTDSFSTLVSSRIPNMGFMVSGIDLGSGGSGGGLIRHPGMAGGLTG